MATSKLIPSQGIVLRPSPTPRVDEPPVPQLPARTEHIVVPGPPGPKGDDGLDSPEAIDLQNHIDHPTPHPAYDDMASLRLIFENGLI